MRLNPCLSKHDVMKTDWEWRNRSTYSLPRHWIEVSGQLHATAEKNKTISYRTRSDIPVRGSLTVALASAHSSGIRGANISGMIQEIVRWPEWWYEENCKKFLYFKYLHIIQVSAWRDWNHTPKTYFSSSVPPHFQKISTKVYLNKFWR